MSMFGDWAGKLYGKLSAPAAPPVPGAGPAQGLPQPQAANAPPPLGQYTNPAQGIAPQPVSPLGQYTQGNQVMNAIAGGGVQPQGQPSTLDSVIQTLFGGTARAKQGQGIFPASIDRDPARAVPANTSVKAYEEDE